MAIVYQHVSPDTGQVFYIGIGKTIKRAFSRHQRSRPWLAYVKKYIYHVEIIKEDITWDEACKLERDLIREYGRRDLKLGNLVNLTDGGDGVVNLPSETLKRIGDKIKGRVGTFKGRKHTEESKKKNRDAHLGKRYSKEVNLKKRHVGIDNGNSKRVYDPKTNTTFPTVKAAAEYFKVEQNTVRDRARRGLLIIKK